MSEQITFEFTGGLADEHLMNFYEASRFQYAAARLLVKLAQFRSSGRFSRNITDKGNVGITLETQEDGSFRINVSAPESPDAQSDDVFLTASLGDLIAYVAERVIEKTDDTDLIALLNANSDIVGIYGEIDSDDSQKIEAVIRDLITNHELRQSLLHGSGEMLERRISEIGRQDSLRSVRKSIARIDRPREQKLIAMAAPLISEMATALRRSADVLKIQSSRADTSGNVLYLNQSMARQIESTKVDEEITPIIGNIIQYNKETGWGKLRLRIASHPISFTVPSDSKVELQDELINEMGSEETYLQLYLVRDRARDPVRAILVGILEMPDE